MTREEASEVITIIRGEVHPAAQTEWEKTAAEVCVEALDLAISTLRGPTRKQVEKMRGKWEWFDEEVTAHFEYQEREWGWRCSKCGEMLPDDFDNPDYTPPMRFCENCGAPMTDEAVDLLAKRLEEVLNAGTGSV